MSKNNFNKQDNTAKLKLLSLVSHEIRTPLHGIIGLTEQLQDTPLSDDQKSLVDHLIHTERILMNLINDVLDYSKLKSAAFDIKLKPASVHTILDELKTLFAPLAAQKSLDLEVNIEVGAEYVLVDNLRLKQVLSNLINNALKFTDSGYIRLECKQTTSTNSDGHPMFRFTVEDSGSGIPEGKETSIFEAYGHSSESHNKNGTGLGLAISNMILNNLGSELHLSKPSASDTGAIFYFDLAMEPTETAPHTKKEQLTHQFEGTRALLVDDDPLVQKITTAMLEKEGISVKTSLSFKSALDCLSQVQPELIFIDLVLGETDGAELLGYLKESGIHSASFICMTASENSKDEILKLGFDAVLRKPFNRRALTRVLSQLSK
ncbi:response regulator [Echinicola soli]|uniref:histidine kinase n=1 Tax=Echinicola soli TaxID=2591634 RepID=A0A514CL69_9BACT|nr:ATP-binding protein [Echinicola soli]QDH80538.1 response regulator [Echinicola soli]